MKRPLLPVALVYTGGLLLAEFWQLRPVVLLVLSFLCLFVALIAVKQRGVLLWPLLILAGWSNLICRTAILSPADLRVVQGTNAALVRIRGELLETPTQRVFERDEKETWRSLARVRVSAISSGAGWRPVAGVVMTSTPAQFPAEFFSGQPVEIEGILLPPPLPVAEGLFDYRAYLARQGIYFQLKTESTNAWRLLPGARGGRPRADRFLAWAQRTLARGIPDQASDQPLRLIWAMTLGWRPALTNEVSEPFMRSGTMHIFAISGLHIALIAGILVSLLRVVQIPRGWCGLIVIPLIWFYTQATGWQPSAIRSTVMMTLIVGGWALRRPTDLLNSLAAAALMILVWEPQQLFQASFQLSFFVVLSIALLLPPLEKVRDRLLAHDPLLPPTLVPGWKRWLGTPLRWMGTAFATSLAAWLGSLPLTAYYFHLFCPVTLLANLLIVPAGSAALACSLGSLICGDWCPWLTEIFNHSGWFWMSLMTRTSATVIALPGAFWYVPSPGIWEFLLYYGLLIGTLSGWLFTRTRRAWTLAGLVAIALIYGWRWQASRSDITITVLPLAGAHAVFVDAAGGERDWLIDCGNTNAVEFVTKPFLHARGVNHLRRLALTHGDLKSVGGTDLLLAAFGVQEIWTSGVNFRSAVYRRIVREVTPPAERRKIVHRGDAAPPWRVLHPAVNDKFPQADDSALVLLGEFHGTRVLLLSDLGAPGQEMLLNREPELRADIVVAGLPERGEPVKESLLDLLQPKLLIVADSEYPAPRRASPELRERLAQNKFPVLYTRFAGAVTLRMLKGGWRVQMVNGITISSKRFDLPRAVGSAGHYSSPGEVE